MYKSTLYLMAAILVITFSCIEENDPIPSEPEQISGIDHFNLDSYKRSPGLCRYSLEFGVKVLNPATGELECDNSTDDLCEVQVECWPDPNLVLDICKLIPCDIEWRDPWIIYWKIDPAILVSLKDKLNFDPTPTPVIPFRMNESILGFQVYDTKLFAKGDPSPQPSKFTLPKDLVLDDDMVKSFGLQGNMIKAGDYPVVFNEKEQTFNILMSVGDGYN